MFQNYFRNLGPTSLKLCGASKVSLTAHVKLKGRFQKIKSPFVIRAFFPVIPAQAGIYTNKKPGSPIRSGMTTTDKTPTIFGKITDALAGGDPVASGPKEVNIKVEKKIIEEALKPAEGEKPLTPEQKEQIKQELEITKPTESLPPPSALEKATSVIPDLIGNLYKFSTAWIPTFVGMTRDVITGVGNGIGTGLHNTGQAIGSGYNNIAYHAPGVTKNILLAIGNGFSTTGNFIATTANNDGDYDFDKQTDKRTTYHEFVINNLQPNTQYHYEVMSQNKNYVYDANRKFMTPAK